MMPRIDTQILAERPRHRPGKPVGAMPETSRDLFDGGPPKRLQSSVGLLGPGQPKILLRCSFVIVVCWAPLAVLSAIRGAPGNTSFLMDFGAHARYLLAAPLLIAAEQACLPRLSALSRHFIDAGLVVDDDKLRFVETARTIRRLLDAIWAEVVVVVLAYLLVLVTFQNIPVGLLPAWQLEAAGERTLSPAGWWSHLVSLPMLAVLLLGWVWRLVLWTHFLWAMARLNLRLVPVHPDGAGGLGFVGYASQAFVILALAAGALAAGAFANDLKTGAQIGQYRYFIPVFVIGVVVLFNAPALVFAGHLLRAWRRGTLAYGALAEEFGREFERKWCPHGHPLDHEVLEQPDFSAATDLYQVVDRVYSMWLLPLDVKSMLLLGTATALPFVPVMLVAVPFDTLVDKLASVFF